MSELIERLTEPGATGRLRALLDGARQRFTPAQRDKLVRLDEARPLSFTTLNAIRADAGDGAALRRHAAEHARRRGTPIVDGDDRFDGLPRLLSHAADKPAVVSALLWTWLGRQHDDFASHLVQRVREQARLPGLRRAFTSDDALLADAGDSLPALIERFADRQAADACDWIEQVPPPLGADDHATLSDQRTAIEQARAAAPRITAEEFSGFAQRAASFLIQLSVQRLDPLGFPLGRQVELDADPHVDRRLEIAGWARRSGHLLCLRGRMLVMAIPVDAPWPLRLELIAAELGRGACGGLGVLLRLHAGAPIAVTESASMLLCFPGEPAEERGPRFERWLAIAYPHATRQWQAWS